MMESAGSTGFVCPLAGLRRAWAVKLLELLQVRRPPIWFAGLVGICIATVMFPARGWAGEMRVVDAQGLTRAYSPLEGAARLEVTLIQEENVRGIHPAILRLRNVDGFSDELVAQGGSGGLYVFQSVRSGVWEIHVADEDVKLRSIKIVKRQSDLADVKESK